MTAERCWNCDRELPEGERFCTACGSPVVDASTPASGAMRGATLGSAPSFPKPPRYYASR